MPLIGYFYAVSLLMPGQTSIICTRDGEALPSSTRGLCECPGFKLDLDGLTLADHVCGDAKRLTAKRKYGRQQVIVLMAGAFAEARYRKANPVATMSEGEYRDMDRARSIALWLFPDDAPGASALLLEAANATRMLVRTHWRAIATLAEALLARGTIDGDDPIVGGADLKDAPARAGLVSSARSTL